MTDQQTTHFKSPLEDARRRASMISRRTAAMPPKNEAIPLCGTARMFEPPGIRMPRAETIRALERGIEVLAVLQSNPISSLRRYSSRDAHPQAQPAAHPQDVRAERHRVTSPCRRSLSDEHVHARPRASAIATLTSPRRRHRCWIGSAGRFSGRPTCSCRQAIAWNGGKPAVRIRRSSSIRATASSSA